MNPLDTFLSLLASLNVVGFELKVDSVELDTPRVANVKEYCLISGAGVPEINGLYEKQITLKDNVGMYTKDGFEIFFATNTSPQHYQTTQLQT